MTYTKKIKAIEITTVGGQTYSLTDTAEDSVASLVLSQIKSGRGTVSFDDNGTQTLLPISAIDHITVTDGEDAEAERANPYGCEAGGDTDTVCFTRDEECDYYRCADISGTYAGKPYTSRVIIEMDSETEDKRVTVDEVIADFDADTEAELAGKIENLGIAVVEDAIDNNKCLNL